MSEPGLYGDYWVLGYVQLHTYARSCAAAVASLEHSGGGVRMDHADRVINETLLNSVNELGQRRCVPLSIYHDHSPPIFHVE